MTTPAHTALQMIRADIDVREFQRWMGTRRLQDPDHAMHCLLTECFGDLAPKPFRLITPRDGPAACLYGYGLAVADELRESAAICADPLQHRIIPAGGIHSKAMPDEFPDGKRLGFEVRLRPVIRKARGSGREEAEVDAFQARAEGFPSQAMPFTRERIYAEWLAARLAGKAGAALDLESVKLVSFQRTRAYRRLRARQSEGPDAVMRGVLTITGPAAFAGALRQGIGRHRSYGYGMLLLRPARA